MSDFYSIITSKGLDKLAALPSGKTLKLTHMGFGNSTSVPYEDQTALGNEQHRCALTKVAIDPNTPHTLIAEAVIKSDIGGFWIREIGVYDEDGDLFAVGKYPATYKPMTTEGSVKELGVRVVLRVSNADTVIVTYNNGIMDGAANTNLDNLTFAGQEKFNQKANIDLDNLTPTGQKKFDDKADLESPTFTGTPKAPTAETGANDDRLANTAFVVAAIAALVNSAPATLDTLKELASALGNDADFATTMTNALAEKAAKIGDTITVASANPTGGFNVRNIKAQNSDPGAGSALADGQILLVYE